MARSADRNANLLAYKTGGMLTVRALWKTRYIGIQASPWVVSRLGYQQKSNGQMLELSSRLIKQRKRKNEYEMCTSENGCPDNRSRVVSSWLMSRNFQALRKKATQW